MCVGRCRFWVAAFRARCNPELVSTGLHAMTAFHREKYCCTVGELVLARSGDSRSVPCSFHHVDLHSSKSGVGGFLIGRHEFQRPLLGLHTATVAFAREEPEEAQLAMTQQNY